MPQNYTAIHTTGEEAVQVLRDRATDAARLWLRPQKLTPHGWADKRPIDQERLSARLNAICTCIEVLTVNGNYARERSQAINRAKESN